MFSELYFGREKNLCPPKHGIATIPCCIVHLFPNVWSGFRIGWVVEEAMPDKFSVCSYEHIIHQFPMQLALVDYLSTRRYDAHLRRLRRQLRT